MYETWCGTILGALLLFSGVTKVVFKEEGAAWGLFPVPVWTGWLFLAVGAFVMTLSIRSICRSKSNTKSYTDEDIAQAEAELNAMYLHETGELPKKPKKEE